MLRTSTVAVSLALAALSAAGCRRGYESQRPPVDQLDRRDRGLQSKDVVNASDDMVRSLLSLPELQASSERWAIVPDRVVNNTTSASAGLDVFLERVRVGLARQGRGKIQLIENRDKYRSLQARELEPGYGEREDTFGQGGGAAPRPGGAGTQPNFSLYANVTDLPNRGTNYYFFEFTLTDLRTREVAWTDAYEVRVAR